MLINADFSRRVVLDTEAMPWLPSPQAGVERRMLDRIGQEQARATSLVRYAPASVYPAHQHPGGEEILVLSGTFVDGEVSHPVGSYLRNPPGSAHQPASPEGAVIFVKLRQMHDAECESVRVNTLESARWQPLPDRSVCPLFDGFGERVAMVRLDPGARLLDTNGAGAEVLLLEGALRERTGGDVDATFAWGTWLRFPAGDGLAFEAAEQGARLYLKVKQP